MKEFRWEERFKLGVRELDEPHRRLVELTAELSQIIAENAPRESIVAAARALAGFTAAHFAEEERLMAETDFPEDAVHKEHHAELLDQLERFAERLATHGSAQDNAKTIAFLRQWAMHHVMHSDRELAKHLRVRVGMNRK